jgi:two-component system cell cycle sensor histidine kinase/response regulator CckA
VTGVGPQPLRLLIVDDVADDAELIVRELRRAYDVSVERVETAELLREKLLGGSWDLLVSDFALPTLTGMDVLRVLADTGIDLPCIIISGTIDEEAAVEALRAGARDFISKNRLARLRPAVDRELREAAARRERRQATAALEAAGERMRFAMRTAGVGTWELDLQTGQVVWSDVLETLHGLPPGSFGGTLDACMQTVHPADQAKVRERLAESRIEQPAFRMEYRTTWHDGSTHWISSIGKVIFAGDGRPVRAAGVALDITGQKNLEEQVRHSQRMDSVGSLAGGIAHDFNNLLTAILGFSNLLLDEPFLEQAPPHFRRDLSEIRKAGERAAVLTGQLLAFSRKQVLQPTVLDLNAVVENLTPMLRRLIDATIHLTPQLASDLALTTADAGQIEQVIMNLVVNARDAMPDGGNIYIQTANVDLDAAYTRAHVDVTPGPYVKLAVTDTGVGMTAEVLARMFEPFFTTKPQGRGTGLGLATIFGIVKQHDGHIWVDSEPGRGTTVQVYFPRVQRPASADAATAPPVARSHGETLLLVEDDEGVRMLARLILKRDGYQVIEASHAEEAVRLTEAHDGRIDLLITDIVMPGESGQTLATRLAQRFPDLRVLYISGYTDGDIMRLGGLPVEVKFLQKPFTTTTLTQAVRDALDAVPAPVSRERRPQT